MVPAEVLERNSMNGGAVVEEETECRRSVPPHPLNTSAIRQSEVIRAPLDCEMRIGQFIP